MYVYEPTHQSIIDGSGADVIHVFPDGRQVVMNECEDLWIDDPGSWLPIGDQS